MKKYTFLLPHTWIDLKGLRRFFLTIFYIDFLVILYTFYHFVLVWVTPAAKMAANSAPLRKLWTAALLQEFLLAVLFLLLVNGFGTLYMVLQKTSCSAK